MLSTKPLPTCLRTDIPIEERSADEVHYTWGWSDDAEFTRVRTTPQQSGARNPAFDVTPAKDITGIITERGIVKPSELGQFRPDSNKDSR